MEAAGGGRRIRGPGRGREAILRIARRDLEALVEALADVVGPEAAEEVLFRVGRRWGEQRAGQLEGGRPAEERFAAAIRGLGALGMGEVTLEALSLGAPRSAPRVLGRVRCPRGGPKGAEGPICGLTIGFLTGLVAGLTGADVVGTPLACGRGDTAACGFEIRPAIQQAEDRSAGAPPAGSARFFLRSMGRGLAEGDVSLDDLLENTIDAVVLIDDQRIVRFWNRGAERMFGFRREEVVGKPVGFIVPQDLLESGELEEIERRLAEGPVQGYVTRRVRKDGVERIVSMTRTVLHDSGGRVIGSTAILHDITEQRRTEEELERSRALAMVGELAAKIAHEIKNPLAGIYAAIQLLGRGLEEGDPKHEIFEELRGEVRRLDDTVQELLSYARPRPAQPRPTGLRAFVEDLLVPLRLDPAVARHELVVDVAEGLIASIDTRLLGQTLTNLVLNAAQAMDEPGTVRIAARGGSRTVEIEVTDTGPGIPAELGDEVFEPFFTTKGRGTGLGLSIARKNVEAHGGTLALDREHAGGARFVLSLPGAPPPVPR